jgi:dolichol-phosphate mannosyltransferase
MNARQTIGALRPLPIEAPARRPTLRAVPRPERLLSVLVPAYNEEATIATALDRLAAVDLSSQGFATEIVVCDDGSGDGTAALVRAAAERHPGIRLVVHPRNRGKGAAIRTALAEARGHYCLVQDADLEYDVADYPALVAALASGVRVVYGSRFLSRRRPRGMRWPNYLANRILTHTANLLYGVCITDEATCLKLIETDLLRSLQLSCTGFEFCPEVTAKIGLHGVPIVEVPISYSGRDVDEGKKIRWTDGVEAMWVLLEHRLRGL